MIRSTTAVADIRQLFDSSTAVIFDFDGVLADSEKFQLEVWRDLLRECGSSHVANIHVIEGRTDLEVAGLLWPEESEEERNRLVLEKKRRCSTKSSEIKPVPGAPSFVRLVSRTKKLYICSSSDRTSILCFLERHFPCFTFELIISGDDVRLHKPDPDPYLTLLRDAALKPNEAFVIEDSRAGVSSALGAKLRVLHLNCHGGEDLDVPSIDSLDELSEVLVCGPRTEIRYPLISAPPNYPRFRIFLSYNLGHSALHELALIREVARDKQIEVISINPGDGASNVAPLIRRSISECDGLLAILHSDSEWCHAEIAIAYAFDLPISVLCDRPIKGIGPEVTSYKVTELVEPGNLRLAVAKALEVLCVEMEERRAQLPERPVGKGALSQIRWTAFLDLIERAKRQILVDPADGGFRPTLILGISRGGIIVADILARLLADIPLGLLNASRFPASITFEHELLPQLLNRYPKTTLDSSPRVLIVDDVLKSGRTLLSAYREVGNAMDQLFGCSSDKVLRTLALVVKNRCNGCAFPHYAIRQLDENVNIIMPYGLG